MIRWWIIVVLVTSMPILSHAQDQASVRLGPAFGYRTYELGIVAPGTGADRTIGPSFTVGYAVGATTGLAIPISSAWSLRGQLGFQWYTADPIERRATQFVVNGTIAQGIIRTDNAIVGQGMNLDVGVEWQAYPRLQIGASVGLAMMGRPSATWQETIESPSGVTFVSTGMSTRTIPNARIAGTSMQPSITVGTDVGTSIPLNGDVRLRPVAYARYNITPALGGTSWRPLEFGLGVHLAMPITPIHRPMVQPDAIVAPITNGLSRTVMQRRHVVSDTVTIIDRFRPGRRDTVMTTTVVVDSLLVQGAMTDTLHLRERRRVERHLPGPTPFIGIILDAHVDSDAVDTVVSVRVRTDVESDTSTRTTIDILVDGVSLHTHTSATRMTEHRVLLRDIVRDIATRERLRVEVRARVTDAYGQTRTAEPTTFTITRVNGSRRFR